jgi:hypothetical protein
VVESEARAESDKQSLEKKITKEKEIIHQKTEERLFTLKFFPLSCQRYYILSG